MKQETREKLEAAGLVQPKEKPVSEPQQGMVFTFEMLQKMLAEERQANRELMLEMAKEIRKPLPHEQEKIDKEIAQLQEMRRRKIKETVEKERLERSIQLSCPHIKHAEGVMKQEHSWRGQVNNDDCCRPICIRCYKLLPPFKVSQENLKSGMALQNISGLTMSFLLKRHRDSFPECKECGKGGCAVRDLREFNNGKLDEPPSLLPPGKVLAEALTA